MSEPAKCIAVTDAVEDTVMLAAKLANKILLEHMRPAVMQPLASNSWEV